MHGVHGIDCPKAAHTGEGYLHAADDDRPYDVDHVWYCGRCHAWMGSELHPRSEVMNPPASAAKGAEARNLTTEPCHRDFGLSLEGAQPAGPADAPPLPVDTEGKSP